MFSSFWYKLVCTTEKINVTAYLNKRFCKNEDTSMHLYLKWLLKYGSKKVANLGKGGVATIFWVDYWFESCN